MYGSGAIVDILPLIIIIFPFNMKFTLLCGIVYVSFYVALGSYELTGVGKIYKLISIFLVTFSLIKTESSVSQL